MKKYRVETDIIEGIAKGEQMEESRVKDYLDIGCPESWFSPVEEEFQEGDWVILTGSYNIIEKGSIFRINKFQCGDKNFPVIEEFGEKEPYRAPHKRNLRKATGKEVCIALIAEAKRRYDVPCKVKYLDTEIGKLQGLHFDYDEIGDVLYASGSDSNNYHDAIYKQGKWASVVDEPIQINGYDITVEKEHVKIDCGDTISRDIYEAFYAVVSKYELDVKRHGQNINNQIEEIWKQL